MEKETDEAETESDADDLSWRGYRYEREEWRLEAGRETMERDGGAKADKKEATVSGDVVVRA